MRLLNVCLVSLCALAIISPVWAEEAVAGAETPEAAMSAEPKALDAVEVAAPVAEIKAPIMPPPLELRKMGEISVSKDASGQITAIKLIVTSYDIILDEGNKPLENINGQKVRVTGTFSMQEGRRCFTVKSVESVAEPALDKSAEGSSNK